MMPYNVMLSVAISLCKWCVWVLSAVWNAADCGSHCCLLLSSLTRYASLCTCVCTRCSATATFFMSVKEENTSY